MYIFMTSSNITILELGMDRVRLRRATVTPAPVCRYSELLLHSFLGGFLQQHHVTTQHLSCTDTSLARWAAKQQAKVN